MMTQNIENAAYFKLDRSRRIRLYSGVDKKPVRNICHRGGIAA